MGYRRSFADDLAEASLPPPEAAMTRCVRVYGIDIVPTQPHCLQRHAKGVYARRLDFQLGFAGPPVDALFRDVVLPRLQSAGPTIRKPEDYLSLLQNILLGVALAHADSVAYGVQVAITFAKNRDAYTRGVGVADSAPGYCILTKLLQVLEDLGFIKVSASKVDGRLSSFIITDELLPFDMDLTPVILSHNGQVVVMTARTKVKGKRLPTGRLTKTGKAEMRTEVTKGGHQRLAMRDLRRTARRYLQQEADKLTVINGLMSTCRLAFCDANGVWHRCFAGLMVLHAVFNDGDTEHGGRNYCGGQSLPQRCLTPIRETLHMALADGVLRALTEVDYKNLHIRMLYALVGVPLPDGFDCYDIPIPGWPVPLLPDGKPDKDSSAYTAQRNFLKVLLLALPNCGSKDASAAKNLQTAYAMARKQYRDWRSEPVADDPDGSLTRAQARARTLPDGVTPSTIVDAILATHRPIADHLYTGKGIELQAVDGQIARNILYHFALKGVPVICVHDSFMIWPEYVDELIALMVLEYRTQMADAYPDEYDDSAPVPELKKKKRTNLPPIPADLYAPIVATPTACVAAVVLPAANESEQPVVAPAAAMQVSTAPEAPTAPQPTEEVRDSDEVAPTVRSRDAPAVSSAAVAARATERVLSLAFSMDPTLEPYLRTQDRYLSALMPRQQEADDVERTTGGGL